MKNGKFIDLVYYPTPKQWRKEKDNATGTPFVGVGDQHPDSGQDAARVWTAPKAGRVRVTGSVCNTGNGVGSSTSYGFRPGSSSYAPWYALYAKDTKQGLFIGWDYFGHWTSSFSLNSGGSVTARLKVAGHKQALAPGESLTTPKAFVGLYHDDLDNAGNECLDWQYRYLWDYTREGWFPAIRMLGYWMNGTGWGQPGAGWTGGGPDYQSTFRKVFRVADLMRYVGADVYHRDWGWWDRAGDWNGPDFRTTISYLRKTGHGPTHLRLPVHRGQEVAGRSGASGLAAGRHARHVTTRSGGVHGEPARRVCRRAGAISSGATTVSSPPRAMETTRRCSARMKASAA